MVHATYNNVFSKGISILGLPQGQGSLLTVGLWMEHQSSELWGRCSEYWTSLLR